MKGGIIMILADYHTHSRFSTDSDASMRDMIEQAINMNLSTLCFTDHMDYDYPGEPKGLFTFDVNDYRKEISSLQEEYQNKITVLAGIELGMQPHLGKRYQSLTQTYPFDFIICSSHIINGLDPYYPSFWKDASNDSIHQSIETYFLSILENIKEFQDFDVYGHIDYVIRYIPDKTFSFVYQDYKDLLDMVLRAIISIGKGIEVNTAGYKYGLNHPNPCEDIISRYIELGGEIITIGSDGHEPNHLAYDFTRVRELLCSLGVSYYTIFQNRKPEFLKL